MKTVRITVEEHTIKTYDIPVDELKSSNITVGELTGDPDLIRDAFLSVPESEWEDCLTDTECLNYDATVSGKIV